ncbi:MAG: DEAD/DEAH box helicase [Clostridiales bacterium]|nr:DEAD/DEAH box helicase [Clostridiales bacterium]
MTNPFYRLAPFIQEYIYTHGWTSLRAIQVAACKTLFETDDNLLLAAGTASGKTEAAFFPILTEFFENPPITVGALYIGPLKALINDQFQRLEDLCREADIPVWHWHGDVAVSHKQKMVKHPSGILQITPESLEAMLMHRHNDIVRLFGDLRYIVVDEIHSLMRGDRGAQVLCLIERLTKLSGSNPRRIGLSATIGDLKAAGDFLSAGSGRKTATPSISSKGTKWRLSMEHFFVSGVQSGDFSDDSVGMAPLDTPKDVAPADADPSIGYIFEHTKGRKCLVFVNSREECEVVTASLRRYCEEQGERDRFLIHHGNLSASYRETAESVMKDDTQTMTTVTTATLELGIDIGKLERAFQIDAPFMVSSFLQRMGRTGRRGEPPEMWFVIREDEPEPRTMLPDMIPWKLLQGIALVQLYVQEKYVEPPKLDRLPFSLLYHQTMSTLVSTGELTPRELASRVLSLSMFRDISQEDYKTLLRHLLSIDHLQRTDEGTLIVGLAGERIVNSFKFYAVFQDNEEYTVRCESQELGTIVMPPPVGERVAIAGHVWVVKEIDLKRRLVYVEQVKGIVPAYFGMCPGDITTKVLERMRLVLQENDIYPYLMKNAVARLGEVRLMARNALVTEKYLVSPGGDMYAFFPWLGTYAFLAMERFLKLRCSQRLGLTAMESARPYYIRFRMKVSEEEFYHVLRDEERNLMDPMELVYPEEVPVFEKYDEYVPSELIRKSFAYDVLGVDELRMRIGTMTKKAFAPSDETLYIDFGNADSAPDIDCQG